MVIRRIAGAATVCLDVCRPGCFENCLSRVLNKLVLGLTCGTCCSCLWCIHTQTSSCNMMALTEADTCRLCGCCMTLRLLNCPRNALARACGMSVCHVAACFSSACCGACRFVRPAPGLKLWHTACAWRWGCGCWRCHACAAALYW